MAQDKDERTTGAGAPRKAAEAEDKKAISDRSAPRAAGNGGTGQGAHASGRQKYLIALRRLGPAMTGSQPQSIDAVADYLSRQEGVEVVARVKPADIQPFASNGAAAQEIVVARMAEGKAESLRAAAQAQVIVERDGPLSLADGLPLPMRASGGVGTVLPLSSVAGELSLRIVGERDQPLALAAVVGFRPRFSVPAPADQARTPRPRLFCCE